ncbi:MAG: hypothetical protein ACRETN_07435 [Nevskiales bacterium]
MNMLEWWEFASYVVTVVGLPLAICVFIYEQRKERQNEEEELYQRLSDEYADFLKLVLDNADLQLQRRQSDQVKLNDEQIERRHALFEILVALFERAYILVYEDHMDKNTRRLWLSWEDYMRQWCRRADFRGELPSLLEGEDEDFVRTIRHLADEEAARAARNGQ